MNIELCYQKVGASHIPLDVKLYNDDAVFYQDHVVITDNVGSIKFWCDFPSNCDCFLEFTTSAPVVVYDTVTFTQIKLDDYWELTTECVTAHKIENGIVSDEANYDSLFYTGSLRYQIHRPIFKWAIS